MILHISFKAESAKTPDIERDIHQHVRKLERFLTAFRPDLVHLHVGIDHHPREGYTISLNLRLPTGQLATQENGRALNAGIRVGFAELISQLKRHKELIRSEHRWRRGRRSAAGAVTELQESVERYVSRGAGESGPQAVATPAVDRNGSAQLPNIPSDAFVYGNLFRADVRNYIDGNLQRLERFVEREIRFREEDGSLQPDLVTPAEVLDEVVVNALSADQPPANLSTVRWIYRLALDAIEHLASSNGDSSTIKLEDPVGTPNVSGTDDDYLQYHEPGETHNREDFLPNQQTDTPEDTAANSEMIEQFEDALRGVRSDQRQAFVLYTIEGFTTTEVAQIMDRDPDQVKELIAAARQEVVKKLPPSNALKQRLIQRSNVA
jgi:RNA polymerase sigma factor (sigma-70 family)